ncbi:MAG TPA: histidine ammonia-lyase [Fimbriimonadaceae bacterium]|nr:histidine ammonia-lyase [Fimbriimonadaceae bacterium]
MELNGNQIDLDTLQRVANGNEAATLSSDARGRMAASRAAVEQIVAEGRTVYGVNTGFGKLSDIHIEPSQLQQLQLNLVRSHACGIGNPLSIPETRAMMLLRANVLSLGFSGARPEVAELLLAMLEKGITPIVPERGSVGASGDLAPLAHLALALIGEGDVIFEGIETSSRWALERCGLTPLVLEVKEGLALLNGTQAMGAVGGLAIARSMDFVDTANVAGAMSLEALMGTPAAFDPRIHEGRPHPGQIEVAAQLCRLMEGSEIRESHRTGDPRVQDAYCLRCMPQVHGAVKDALRHAREVVERESASATDNPLVFVETGEVISGGNFHGAPLAYVFDYAAIALCDLGAMIERRIDRLVNPDLNEGLPPFLAPHAGVSSGMMMAQVTAAAVLNECRVLAHPASSDNTPTSGGKEDHVSMGMTAALKLRRMVDNLEILVAIELMAAAQGLEYRKPLRPAPRIQSAHDSVRMIVTALEEDRPLGGEIERLAAAVRAGLFLSGQT